jgi:glycosyltransferase involved in cell wall biosynthesis
MAADRISLSICIATRNRGQYIGETLGSILGQCGPDVEIVVVDGASTDSTSSVVSALAAAHTCLRYFPQTANSGVDGDFDKAVELAHGSYCWLMPDDDLIVPGGIARVIEICNRGPDAVIVDAEVRTADLTERLTSGGSVLPGSVTTPNRREWLLAGRTTSDFYRRSPSWRDFGSAASGRPIKGASFSMLGYCSSAFAGGVIALGEPLVLIRYGVGNWTSRSSQVWMFKWPALIWSFGWLSVASRAAITRREPWRSFSVLLLYRAKGWYSWQDFIQLVWPQAKSRWHVVMPAVVALIPGQLLNMAALALLRLRSQDHRGGVYDLRRSPYFVGRR